MVGSFIIDNYKLVLAREIRAHGAKALAAIYAYAEDPSQGRLEIFFLPDDQELPDNTSNQGATRGTLYLPVAMLDFYIDTLRNESPVYARISQNNPRYNKLETSFEPAGEGESGIYRIPNFGNE